jgi:hypothetical protein
VGSAAGVEPKDLRREAEVVLVIAGHGLVAAGASHGMLQCTHLICRMVGHGARVTEGMQDRGGHGFCECGEGSPHLFSNRERRQWHRQHKDVVVSQEQAWAV